MEERTLTNIFLIRPAEANINFLCHVLKIKPIIWDAPLEAAQVTYPIKFMMFCTPVNEANNSAYFPAPAVCVQARQAGVD